MLKQIDAGAQRADEKVIKGRPVVVRVMKPHDAQPTVDVKRGNAVTQPNRLDEQSRKVFEPARV